MVSDCACFWPSVSSMVSLCPFPSAPAVLATCSHFSKQRLQGLTSPAHSADQQHVELHTHTHMFMCDTHTHTRRVPAGERWISLRTASLALYHSAGRGLNAVVANSALGGLSACGHLDNPRPNVARCCCRVRVIFLFGCEGDGTRVANALAF